MKRSLPLFQGSSKILVESNYKIVKFLGEEINNTFMQYGCGELWTTHMRVELWAISDF